jgi:hypothetical protein
MKRRSLNERVDRSNFGSSRLGGPPELVDRFSKRLSEFRQPLGTEHQQGHQQDEDEVNPMIPKHGTNLLSKTGRSGQSIAPTERFVVLDAGLRALL